ncbi:MAG: hypothetical protein AAGF28_09740 [Pseudomonadota bacterium]
MQSVTEFLLRALLVFSLAALTPGIGASAAERNAEREIELSQYRLPDGSLPVLCLGAGADSDVSSEHCPDCWTGKQTGLPSSSDMLDEGAERCAQLLKVGVISSHARQAVNPSRSPRGPPLG